MATKGYTWEEAVDIVQRRKAAQSPLLRRMIDVQTRYNGEYVLPAPASGPDTTRPVLIAQLVDEAIDQPAMRAASVMPMFFFPALDENKSEGKRSKDWATRRRRATSATMSASSFDLQLRRAFRHIGGYSRASICLWPDDELQMPRFSLRDPLSSYPEPKSPEDPTPPRNIGYVHQRSTTWLVQLYPEQVQRILGQIDRNVEIGDTEMWDVLEWVDADRIRLGVMGPSNPEFRDQTGLPNAGTELMSWPNKAGCVAAVCPQVITLDKIIARASHMLGKMDMLAYLWDLDIQATEAAIFPDRYGLARPNETPRVVDGNWKSGRTGEINLVEGVAQIGELIRQPNPYVMQRMQALEDHARQDTGAVSLYGGQAGSYGQRTGRGQDTLMSIAVDPRVQELQQIMAESLRQLVDPMFEMYKGYWPDRKYTLFSGWPTDRGMVEFTPSKELAESSACTVNYAIPGADRGQTTIQVGQLAGAKLISDRTARMLHPDVADPDGEERLVFEEALDNMLLETIHQGAVSGTIVPEDAAVIRQKVRAGATLDEAILAAHQAAQARQAAMAPPAGPGQATAPEEQPGLGLPGQGAEQAPAAGGQAPGSLQLALAALGRQPPTPQAAPVAPVAVR